MARGRELQASVAPAIVCLTAPTIVMYGARVPLGSPVSVYGAMLVGNAQSLRLRAAGLTGSLLGQ
jgi:hypothetical protein